MESYFKVDDMICMLMEFIDGVNLSQFINMHFTEKVLDKDNKMVQMTLNDRMYDFEQSIKYDELINSLEKAGDRDLRYLMQGEIMKIVQERKIDFSTDFQHKKLNPKFKVNGKSGVKYQYVVEYIFFQIITVLVELQHRKIMHRDLKPDNIMITHNCQIKFIDFGTCKKAASVQGDAVGTRIYFAPELTLKWLNNPASTFEYSDKVDVWAAGAVLYELVCGFTPFVFARNAEF